MPIFIKQAYLREGEAVQRLGALVCQAYGSTSLPAPLTTPVQSPEYAVHCHQHQPPRLGNLTASLSKRNREFIILDAFGLFVIVWCSAHHSLTHSPTATCMLKISCTKRFGRGTCYFRCFVSSLVTQGLWLYYQELEALKALH